MTSIIKELVCSYRRNFSPLCVIAGVLLFGGCAPKKGYEGPERPDIEISIIEVEHNTGEVSFDRAFMNGIDFGSSGIKVLPGPQRYDLTVTLKDPPHYCRAYPEMNHYGYAECRKKKEYCDCFDYLTIKEDCRRRIYSANCQGSVTTRAGRRYSLHIQKSRDEARVSVAEQGSYAPIGKGDCDTLGSDEEEYTEYVGSGRTAAYSNGISWCGD